MNNNFFDLLNKFIDLKTKNLQLDVFRDNGQVLLQIYKQYDVNSWQLNFNSSDLNAIVVELNFHKDKTDNKNNLERFLSADFFKDFKELEKNIYFIRFDSNLKVKELYDKILGLINTIYDLKKTYVEYTLNAY